MNQNTAAHRSADSAILSYRATQVQRGSARAAVLGVNDGLVSTLCIVLAVAGAGGSPRAVLIAGFAGLLAGALQISLRTIPPGLLLISIPLKP